jgi:putative permease
MRPAKSAAVVLGTILCALVLWKLHVALAYLLASLAIAAAVNLVADALAPRGVPRWLGLGIAYVIGLVMAGALVWMIGRAVVIEAPRGADHYAAAYDRLKTRAASVHGVARLVLDRLPASKVLYREIGDASSAALALELTGSLLDGILFSMLALVLSVYWAGRKIHLERLVGAVVGPERRSLLFRHWRAVAIIAGAYLRRGLVECALCATGLALALRLLGIEPWALPSAAAALALLVPFLGPALAVAIGGLAGLATSPSAAFGGGLSALVIVVLLRGVLAQRLSPVPHINPLVLVATAMVLGSAIGMLGVVLAPFAATAVTITARRLLARRITSRAPRLDPAAFAARARLLRRASLTADTVVPDEVRHLVDRLHLLVEEGDALLAATAVGPHATLPHRGKKCRAAGLARTSQQE